MIDQNTLVSFGENTQVTMQTVQDIYSKITGKSESISRIFDTPHITTFEDFKQLNTTIEQALEQYHITAKNCSVELYQINGQKQTFSSFGRFSLYEAASKTPVENVRITHEFLLVLPQTLEPQTYKIEINIHSRAALIERESMEVGIAASILSMISSATGNVKISYIDYSVAKNFYNITSDWFESLDASKRGKLIGAIQKYSTHAPATFAVTATLSYIIVAWSILGSAVAKDATIVQMSSTLIWVFGGAIGVWGVTRELGRVFERHVDRILPISALKLTKGDEKMLLNQQKRNSLNMWAALGSIAISIGLNVASSFIVAQIGIK